MIVEDMFLQLIFRRTAEKVHRAPIDDAKEGTIMPVDMILLLTGAAKSLMVVMAADTGAFEPIAAIELVKFLCLNLRKRTRMHFLKNRSDLVCNLP
jgi:hypothetical protein